MKTAYLDAFSGLSGDMIVGAMLDCGADFGELERAIASMPLRGYRLATRRKTLSGISALKFEVEVTEPQPQRHFGEIRAMIDASALAATIKASRDRDFRSSRAGRSKDSRHDARACAFPRGRRGRFDYRHRRHGVGTRAARDRRRDRVATADGQRLRALAARGDSSAGAGDGGIAGGFPAEDRRRRASRWSRRPARQWFVRSRGRRQSRLHSRLKRSATGRARASWKIVPTYCG